MSKTLRGAAYPPPSPTGKTVTPLLPRVLGSKGREAGFLTAGAMDVEDLSCDILGEVGGKEEDGPGDVLRPSEGEGHNGGAVSFFREQVLVFRLRRDPARRHGVHPDPEGTE